MAYDLAADLARAKALTTEEQNRLAGRTSGTGLKATSPTLSVPAPTNTLPTSQIRNPQPAPVQNIPPQDPTPSPAPPLRSPVSAPSQPLGTPNVPNVQPTPSPATPPYSPPNQGTTGVSQGGIIGNLIGIANQDSPDVVKAREDLKKLQENYATQTANIEGSPIDLSLSTGQQGILGRLFAAKQGAAQTGLANALTSQQQRITATQGAGSLNAPIVNPQTQGLVSPSSNLTTGGTTSGAVNLQSMIGKRSNSLGIGTRIGADGRTTEYFDMATGKGFSSPQELANFMNARQPNLGANAQNVFDIIKKEEFYNKNTGVGFTDPQQLAAFVNQQLGSNIATPENVFDIINQQQNSANDPVKPNDPYYQTLLTVAGLLSSNQVDAANNLMASMPAAVKAQVIRMAQGQGYNANIAAAIGSAQYQNTLGAGTAAQEAAKNTYIQAYPAVQQLNQALNNVDSAANITVQNAQGQNVNPFAFVPLNETINSARSYFSSPGVAVFNSNLANLEAAIRNIYAANGGSTPSGIEGQIQNIINGSMQMDTLKALIATAQQEGRARLANAQNTAQSSWNQLQQSQGVSTNSGSSVDSIISRYLK